MPNPDYRQINVLVSPELLKRIDDYVPAKGRSEFFRWASEVCLNQIEKTLEVANG